MNYFSHRRFNWIDLTGAVTCWHVGTNGHAIAGVVILAGALVISVIMESKYGR